jgi:hypothetical protein
MFVNLYICIVFHNKKILAIGQVMGSKNKTESRGPAPRKLKQKTQVSMLE